MPPTSNPILNPLFAALPQPLLLCLGQWQTATHLAQVWQHASNDPIRHELGPASGARPAGDSQTLAERLRRAPAAEFRLSQKGLNALLHRAPTENPGAHEEPRWGLHAVCLHTGAAGDEAWPGLWPGGIDAKTIHSLSPAELAQRLARDPQAAVIAPGMVCAEVEGHRGRPWSLLGVYDPANQRLHMLVLGRLGEWVDAAPKPAPADAGRNA